MVHTIHESIAFPLMSEIENGCGSAMAAPPLGIVINLQLCVP
jgi:hypothetical protein